MNFSPEKAATKRVLMLSGEEEQLRRRALKQILEHLNVQKDDFDLQYIGADESSPIEWLASAGTAPFMAERRIVVVRSLLRHDPDVKTFDLSSLPETALLILVVDEEISSSDDKARKLASTRGKWEKAVVAAGGHLEQFKVDPKALRENLKAEASKAGKKLSDKAAETLMEMTGASASRALDELDKLIIFSGTNDQIREDYVRELVIPSREWNVFKMVDGIVAGAAPEALRQLRILVGSQAKSEDAAIGRVLPMVGRALRLLWQARVCVDAGCSPSNLPDQVASLMPAKPNIASEPPYRQSSLMQTARKVDLDALSSSLQVLADTDARLKGSLASFSTMDTLERMILDMVAVIGKAKR